MKRVVFVMMALALLASGFAAGRWTAPQAQFLPREWIQIHGQEPARDPDYLIQRRGPGQISFNNTVTRSGDVIEKDAGRYVVRYNNIQEYLVLNPDCASATELLRARCAWIPFTAER